MSNYGNLVKTSKNPYTKQSPNQVTSSDGAYVFQIDAWELYDRFLFLGTANNTYYASAKQLTVQAIQNFSNLLKEDGLRFITRAHELSFSGRIPNNNTALLALAYAPSKGSDQTKRDVAGLLPNVPRTASDFFLFIEYARMFRGWGTALRHIVSEWYNSFTVDDLAYQMLKYQSRKHDKSTVKAYSHAALLKLAHVYPKSDRNDLYRYVRGHNDVNIDTLPEIVKVYETIKLAGNDAKAVKRIIESYNNGRKRDKLTHEFVPTEVEDNAGVWEALLSTMPLNALLWNLGKLSKLGIIGKVQDPIEVTDKLVNPAFIEASRIHPIKALNVKNNYQNGGAAQHGIKRYATTTWSANPHVVAALEDMFYMSFQYVEPIDKNIMVALDVSGSMNGGYCNGVNLTPREASTAMCLSYVKKEPNVAVVAFSSDGGYYRRVNSPSDGVQYLPAINKNTNLDHAIGITNKLKFAATALDLPMLFALNEKLDIDAFLIYTDNELNSGIMQPYLALQEYRNKMDKPKAAMVVHAMTANNISIANPDDRYMLDVCGFDAAVPNIVRQFVQ